MKYTKEGIERSGEIWREGLAKFPSSPLLTVKLGWHHITRTVIFISDDPQADVRKAGELAQQVLVNEYLSPQVARLANWLTSHVLVRERDFDGALAAADRAVALAPYDTFMLSSSGASAIVGTADIRRSSTDAIYEYTGAVICMVLIWTLSPGLNEAFGELLAEVLCHRRVAVDRHKSGRRELVGDRLAKVAGPATAIENHGSILQRR